jgi:hypothetical protein
VNFGEPRPRAPRAFNLATELRVLAAGLFAVAAGALALSGSARIAPVEVAGAAAIVVLLCAANIAIGLAGVRRTARSGDATDGADAAES